MKHIIIDVREADEFASGHVDGAINIPLGELARPGALNSVPKDTEIITYCRSGSRSQVALQMLNKLGYTKVINGINQQHIEADTSN